MMLTTLPRYCVIFLAKVYRNEHRLKLFKRFSATSVANLALLVKLHGDEYTSRRTWNYRKEMDVTSNVFCAPTTTDKRFDCTNIDMAREFLSQNG